MQGTDTSVEVPQEVTLLNAIDVESSRAPGWSRAGSRSSEKLAARAVSPTTSTNTRGFVRRHATRIMRASVPTGSRARVRIVRAVRRVHGEAIDVIAGRDEITQLALIAHERSEVARDHQHREHRHHEGRRPRSRRAPACARSHGRCSMRTNQMNATGNADHEQHPAHHAPRSSAPAPRACRSAGCSGSWSDPASPRRCA